MTPGPEEPHPKNMTAGDLLALGRSLGVHCVPCGVLRDADLARIFAARPDQRIAEMVFRCAKCGTLGAALLTWRGPANEWMSFGFSRAADRRGTQNAPRP